MTNFVVLVGDDMRWDLLDHMPLTKSAGINFTNAHVANPVCCASRVSTLTGRHSSTTQIWGNNPPVGGFEKWRDLNGEADTIAVKLSELGYATSLMGKYVNEYNIEHTSYVPPGWTEWMAITTGGGRYYDVVFSRDGEQFVSPPGEYLTDFLANEASAFIQRQAASEQPFFLWVAPTSPHKDHVPAVRHTTVDFPDWRPYSFNEPVIGDKPAHYAGQPKLTSEEIAHIDTVNKAMRRCVLSLDEAFAQIVNTLITTGLDQDTIVFFMSDNGFMLGEHRLYGKSVPYLEATRMPFVVRWMGQGSGELNSLAQNIDIAPTIAEVAGVEGVFDGVSLRPYIDGEPTREYVYIEHHANNRQPAWATAQKKNRTYTWHSTGEEEWYNLNEDPLQRNNRMKAGTPPPEAELRAARNFVNQQLTLRGYPPGMTTKPSP